jgi:uncharacterized ferritin-like protein (DUF455 family)
MGGPLDLETLAKSEILKTKEIFYNYPWEDPIAYAMWLVQTYHMVAHSTRLVALAGALVPVGREELHARFVDHSKEERGHQLVCVSDLKALGYSVADFPTTAQALAMYQIQYYWIQQRGSASFFGYTLALECLAEQCGPEIAARVLKAHGPKASVFLKLHSQDDQEHTQSAYKLLKNLSQEEAQAAKENLVISCEIYRAMLIEAKVMCRNREKTIFKAS